MATLYPLAVCPTPTGCIKFIKFIHLPPAMGKSEGYEAKKRSLPVKWSPWMKETKDQNLDYG